ncbi:MAG: chemotaxis protein CheA [Oligoflexia bacterium]|nr:chemotaxis protein CheA [Oligoflexia bacterium]
MKASEIENQEVIKDFLQEAQTILLDCENMAVDLSADKLQKNAGIINTVFGHIHSIKGSSGFFNFDNVINVAHKFETLLGQIKNGEKAINQDLVTLILEGIDHIKQQILKLDSSLEHTELSDEDRAFIKKIEEISSAKIGDEVTEAFQKTWTDFGTMLKCQDANLLRAIDPIKLHQIIEQAKVLVDLFNHKVKIGEVVSKPNEAEEAEEAEEAKEAEKAEKEEKAEDAKKGKEEKFIRINQNHLDLFLHQIGEILLQKEVISYVQGKIAAGNRVGAAADFAKELKNAIEVMEHCTIQLQTSAMTLRKMPVGQLFSKYKRVVRDLSLKLDKVVEVEMIGEEILVDKNLLDGLDMPLTHLVRNSIDHGIENATVRGARGKRPHGKITLRAETNQDWTTVEISDDGNGLDLERIRSKAVSKGIVSDAEAKKLSQEEIYALIFKPGFSTNEVVNEISGRGVGMDVVKTSIDKLNGKIQIHSVPEKGSTFILKLPNTSTLMTKDSIICKMGQQVLAIPLENIIEVIKLRPADLHVASDKQRIFCYRDKMISIATLAEILNYEYTSEDSTPSTSSELTAIILSNGKNDRVAVIIDRTYGKQSIVIRVLNKKMLNSSELFLGSAILGDGQIVLVINAETILQTMHQSIR